MQDLVLGKGKFKHNFFSKVYRDYSTLMKKGKAVAEAR